MKIISYLMGLGPAGIAQGLLRWVFVALAVYILLRSLVALIKTRNPAEVWAYMHVSRYNTTPEGYTVLESEISEPITHWENVIGRAKSCDIQVDDDALSRNHGLLMRSNDGTWKYRDLGSKNGTYLASDDDLALGEESGEPVEFVRISKKGQQGPFIDLEYGDTLRAGMTEFTLFPISIEEKNNNINMRKADTRIMSAGPTLAALTLFQILTIVQLWISLGTEYLPQVFVSIGGLCVLMWVYVAMVRTSGRSGFEMECIAFFLSTLCLSVVASKAPNALVKQIVAIALGVAIMYIM